MLYHYYMKINLKLFAGALLALSLLPCLQAQITVVKQDGKKIYLDTSAHNRTLAVGDSFKVITSQEKLTNPTTGKDLGMLNHYSADGKIIEVQELYAVGEMPDTKDIKIGQEAVVEQNTVPSHNTAAANVTHAQPAAPVSDRKIKTYTVLEREIISAVQADLTPQPGEEIAALDTKGNLLVYSVDGNTLQEMFYTQLPVGSKPLTLSAKDVMQSGHAQLFAVVYDENAQKITTLVFQATQEKLNKIATLPYFVKELGCGENKEIYSQHPFIGGARGGEAHKLIYTHDRFKLDKDSFSTRGNWLTGVNRYQIQQKDIENLVYTASTGRLRVRLQNGKFADSADLFASTPNRIRYKQEMVPFYPSVQVYGPNGAATLAAVENRPGWGLLSHQFGQYKGSNVHFLKYENGTVKVTETLPLDGLLYDTNCTQQGILAPQVLSSGQTVLTEIYR